MKNIWLLSLILLFSACLPKIHTPKNPCILNEYAETIDLYSDTQLLKLVQILEDTSYGNQKSEGCKKALLGKILLRIKKTNEASDYFALAAKSLPDLAEYFLITKAQLDLDLGNLSKAQTIAQALLKNEKNISKSSVKKLKKILADIAVKQNDNQQIVKTHHDLLAQGTMTEDTLFNLAQALQGIGEEEKSKTLYKQLLVSFPTSSHARKITEQYGLIHFNWDIKEIEKRFDKLVEKQAFTDIIKDTKVFCAASTFNDAEKAAITAKSLRSLMLNNQFEEALNIGAQQLSKKITTPHDLEGYAFGLAKAGHFVEAHKYYTRLYQESPTKKDQALGCFFAGFSLYEASFYALALASWQKCAVAIDSSEYDESYHWYQALSYMLLENYQQALEILLAIQEKFNNSTEIDKYAYFQGVCLKETGKFGEGEKLLKILANKSPHYYSQLAKHMLKEKPIKGRATAEDILIKQAGQIDHDAKFNAALMFHLGFKNDARDVITRSTLKSIDKIALLSSMGFHHDALTRYSQPSSIAIKNNQLSVNQEIRALFPLPYKSIVDQASNTYGIDSNLLYAIMKTESHFLETAISPRGAIGLMQMMPHMAVNLLPHTQLGPFKEEILLNPALAIKLGALLLSIHERQFHDSYLVAAAYNAGPHNVKKWLDLFGHLPKELFIERIPFKQTRDYVKKVMQQKSLYQALAGHDLTPAIHEP